MSAAKTQVTQDVSELSPEAPDSDQTLSLPEDDKHPFPHDISPSVALVPYFAELICSEGISEKVSALRFDALKMLQGLIHHYDECGYSDTLLNGIAEKKGAMIRFRDGRVFSRKTHILYRADYYALPQVQAFIEVAGRHEQD